ncbi:hypothetical protein BDR07DRAFT_1406319 [Suillus spraguei]|nr:hypothetical protein BDR07DRAFT_1406319 [Suillus spraguei]
MSERSRFRMRRTRGSSELSMATKKRIANHDCCQRRFCRILPLHSNDNFEKSINFVSPPSEISSSEDYVSPCTENACIHPRRCCCFDSIYACQCVCVHRRSLRCSS